MVGKAILPLYGGTPAIWNSCMLFFQIILLAGYAYAHFSLEKLQLKRQPLIHMALLLTAFILLPITIGIESVPPPEISPPLFLLYKLLIAVGLPFFLVSSTGPLLQRWFMGTGHPSGKDPYFLYAASNIGSLVALLGYPLLFEPGMSLDEQSSITHHLIDIVDPDETFNLALYQPLAYEAIEDILQRGKLPLLVGGSGLYVWSILEGWCIPRVPPDSSFRRQMEERAAREGVNSLYPSCLRAFNI